ncbi:hypothetical protein J7443_09885 [Tropicibacter sp. R15_0]|uniref:hypothetical protein n=1 Tax=Tropicibacter sp. R15_0 TaxID=2821101 RepID=UPI001ADC362C|nr:hypothetical protein [Tropicibacter sp. R15_0]MBO9465536.1 hypothetical protein [Tropicibacter sp. R15_0]
MRVSIINLDKRNARILRWHKFSAFIAWAASFIPGGLVYKLAGGAVTDMKVEDGSYFFDVVQKDGRTAWVEVSSSPYKLWSVMRWAPAILLPQIIALMLISRGKVFLPFRKDRRCHPSQTRKI